MRNFTRLWRASVAPTPILLLASDSGNTIVSRQKTASWLLRVRHCYRDHLPVQLPQVTREHIAHLQVDSHLAASGRLMCFAPRRGQIQRLHS
ncbi:hypothetical protein IQ06DRAFT_63759 [Phaeosphaeriaceae sp. SRC1lsM3a]|nr:hypothetical protein IQ06DRAFT_63759 [Stagonospora sp. SRC1lsM3a]